MNAPNWIILFLCSLCSGQGSFKRKFNKKGYTYSFKKLHSDKTLPYQLVRHIFVKLLMSKLEKFNI